MGALLLLIGLAVLGFGFFNHLKGKRILAAPFRKTGELAKNPTSPDPKGLMSTEGAVIVTTPLLSPCSKTPCLYYEVEIVREWEKQEKTQDGVKTKSGSSNVSNLKQGGVFQLDDGTGAITVDANKGGDFDNLKKNFDKKISIGAFVPGELQFGELRMQTPSLPGGEQTTGFKAVEKIVPVGGNLFALGKLENGTLAKPGWRSMMFSSKGRDGLLAATAKKKKFSFIGGGVAAVAAIPLMIFGPSSSGHSQGCEAQLTGVVASCKGNLTADSGDSYTWTVTAPANYHVVVTPAAGKKNPLDAMVSVTGLDGTTVADATSEAAGLPARATHDFAVGVYKIVVKDLDGQTVKGGFDYSLEITGDGVASPAVAAGTAIEVSPKALLADYEANSDSADAKYKGKALRISGVVDSVEKEDDGKTFLTLEAGDDIKTIWAYVKDDQVAKAGTVKHGDNVTVTCIGDGQLVNILTRDCAIDSIGAPGKPVAVGNPAPVKAKKVGKKK